MKLVIINIFSVYSIPIHFLCTQVMHFSSFSHPTHLPYFCYFCLHFRIVHKYDNIHSPRFPFFPASAYFTFFFIFCVLRVLVSLDVLFQLSPVDYILHALISSACSDVLEAFRLSIFCMF